MRPEQTDWERYARELARDLVGELAPEEADLFDELAAMPLLVAGRILARRWRRGRRPRFLLGLLRLAFVCWSQQLSGAAGLIAASLLIGRGEWARTMQIDPENVPGLTQAMLYGALGGFAVSVLGCMALLLLLTRRPSAGSATRSARWPYHSVVGELG